MPPKLKAPIAISFGASAGALSRYYISLGLNQWLGTALPFATFFINISGAFVMGFFTCLTLKRNSISPDLRLMIAIGFLGSYTTFSTYTLDLEKLVANWNWQATFFYWMGSTFLGLLSLEAGGYLARKLPSKAN